MSRLPLRTIEDAPNEAKAALINAEKNNGYLPNLLRVLANAPVALETYLTVSGINARSSLPCLSGRSCRSPRQPPMAAGSVSPATPRLRTKRLA